MERNEAPLKRLLPFLGPNTNRIIKIVLTVTRFIADESSSIEY